MLSAFEGSSPDNSGCHTSRGIMNRNTPKDIKMLKTQLGSRKDYLSLSHYSTRVVYTKYTLLS